MTVRYETVDRSYPLPELRTPDSIAELVRAILSQKDVNVLELKLVADPPRLSARVSVPAVGPPDGAVPTMEPEDVWEAIGLVEIEELDTDVDVLRVEAVREITSMLVRASRLKLAGVGWVVGNPATFMKWLGLKEGTPTPTMFWNMPLIRYQHFPDDKLILLCGRTVKHGPLRAEIGIMVHMKEAEDARQEE